MPAHVPFLAFSLLPSLLLPLLAATPAIAAQRLGSGSSGSAYQVATIWNEIVSGRQVAAAAPAIGQTRASSTLQGSSGGAPFEVTIDPYGVTFRVASWTSTASVGVAPYDPQQNPPVGYYFVPNTCFDISTHTLFSGQAEITIPYSPAAVSNGDAGQLRMFHFTNGVWQDITTSVDTQAHTVTGLTSSFSNFGIGQPMATVGTVANQQRMGARVPVTVTVDSSGALQYSSGGEGAINGLGQAVAGGGTCTYEDWQPGLLGNAQTDPQRADFAGNSPHGNYTTATVKCVVCHAVHYAAPSIHPVPSDAQDADTLLRIRADSGCIFCHATAGMAVNGRPVYNGLGEFLGGGVSLENDTVGENNVGHITGANCSNCHTNVHGANADTSVAALDGYLLITIPVSGVDGDPGGSTGNMLEAIDYLNSKEQSHGFPDALPDTTSSFSNVNDVAHREWAVGIFCAECHNGAYATGVPGATTSVRSGTSTLAFTGHRIGAAATGSWNSDGSISSGIRSVGQAASLNDPNSSCVNCHNAVLARDPEDDFDGDADDVSPSIPAFGDASGTVLCGSNTIAWAPVGSCKSCHDATDNYGNAAFPHAWGRYNTLVDTPTSLTAASSKMWLTQAPMVGMPKAPVAAAAQPNSADYQLTDGVCLKCHIAPGAVAGVGISY